MINSWENVALSTTLCRIGPSVDIKRNAVSGNWRCNDLLFLVTKVCFYFFKFSVIDVGKSKSREKYTDGCLASCYRQVQYLSTLLHLPTVKLTVSQPYIYISQCKRDIIYLLHLDKVKLEYCRHSKIMHRSWREMQINHWRKVKRKSKKT